MTRADSPTDIATKETVQGLRLHATLPYDHYGPHDPVKVYLTFLNTTGREAILSLKSPIVIKVKEKDRRLSFNPVEAKVRGQAEPDNGKVTLKPGQSFMRAVVIEKGHKSFLPGKHSVRVYCKLEAYPLRGQKKTMSILRSNELTLNVRYDVIIVY